MRLPKELVGLKFNELFFIELNDFDVDMLLPAFFWMVRSGGKPRVESAEREPALLLGKLVAHEKTCGFESSDGQRILGKWLRTSVIQTLRKGRGRAGKEEVSYAKPLSFLVFKGPSPRGGSLRQTHLFLHDLLSRLSLSRGQERLFLDLVKESFARGIELREGAVKDGSYDQQTHVDLEVLLSMYFLDGLPGARESVSKTGKPSEPVCPMAARIFAEDVVLFLTVYGQRLSPPALARHLAALLNFEFLHYTLCLCKGINSLVFGQDAKELSRDTSQSRLDLYVDITQDRTGRSASMSQACINRDLEEVESYLRSSLLLKTTFEFVSENPDLRRGIAELDGCERIKALNELRTQPDVLSDARALLKRMRLHFSEELEEGETLPDEITELLDDGDSALDRAVNTLYHLQRKDAVNKAMRWIQWTGGLRRGDGILEGNLKGRRNWRYSLSDPLLEALCMIAAASPEVQEASGTSRRSGHDPRPILLSAFLEFLKTRYGILIAQPPTFEQGAEAVASAKDNLMALRRRLRQMGLFQDLSDDFNAQRIEPRYPRDLGY